jgi:hypothetical protein
MVRIAGKISKEYKVPRVFILADMVVCSVLFYAGYYDYHEWDFNLMNLRQRRTFLTRPQANQLTLRLNKREFSHIFTNKAEFNKRFDKYIGREWLDVRATTTEELRDFVTRHGKVMLKDPVNLGGYGLEKREAASIDDYEAFREQLLRNNQFLVEEFITQHPELMRLSPKSVNTLRIITYFDGTDVHVLAHAFKMGNGADLDNFGQGGIQTTLYDDGVALYGAFDKEGNKFLTHPQTGVDIVGFVVPLYAEALAMADEMARIVPEVPYIGWDIAIAPDRPIVIEGNYNSGVFQMKPSLSGIKTGLRPSYQQAIGFK